MPAHLLSLIFFLLARLPAIPEENSSLTITSFPRPRIRCKARSLSPCQPGWSTMCILLHRAAQHLSHTCYNLPSRPENQHNILRQQNLLSRVSLRSSKIILSSSFSFTTNSSKSKDGRNLPCCEKLLHLRKFVVVEIAMTIIGDRMFLF